MVKLTELRSTNTATKKCEVALFADTKSDVEGTTFVPGMLSGCTMDFGSTAVTADGDIGFLKSDGTWNWVE